MTADDLRVIDLFETLDDPALTALAAASTELVLEPGELLLETGAQPVVLFCVLDGQVESYTPLPSGRERRDKFHTAPTFLGVISLLSQQPLEVSIRAHVRSRFALVPRATFREVMHAHPDVERHAMAVFLPTMQRIGAATQQREKLAALGTMAAGLAHELNNPAAAAQRLAGQLGEALAGMQEAGAALFTADVEPEVAAELLARQQAVLDRAVEEPELSALARADAEDVLGDRLDEAGVRGAWSAAEQLAAAGLDAQWVDEVVALAGTSAEAVVHWIAASLAARGLAADLRISTARISSLVAAVKDYTYMDQDDEQEVDVHTGLDATLRILGHRLHETGVDVARVYADDLPLIAAHGSQLNQVWTNLLENAIDAASSAGAAVTVTTGRTGGSVEVVIHNGGPPVGADVLARAFEPFFTTKPVGAGTGLGLPTAYRIVTDTHEGSLTLTSDAGGTAATVRLPVGEGR
jgi:signal transduction histidine kinase